MNCRHCGYGSMQMFLDLGFAPPSNAYRSSADLRKPEKYFPLRVVVCSRCWLAQTEDYAAADELFSPEYAYFSSTSTGWCLHAKSFVDQVTEQFALNQDSFVIEIASNDGYLLKHLVEARVPCLGIEPTASTAVAAEAFGVPVLREFFGEELGRQLASGGQQADLIVGNNVYAHVPDINDFTRGLGAALKIGGTISLEFPHLMRLLERAQFDTVYHEHFSYLSLSVVCNIFERAGLRVWDVEELATHGGSLRVFGCHSTDVRQVSPRVHQLLSREADAGLRTLQPYLELQFRADKIKTDLLAFLIRCKAEDKKLAAYGAAAKGNTLLNYAGIKPDLVPFVCDAAVAKQNKYTPGGHLPILAPSALIEEQPDYVLILPWNIAEECKAQLSPNLPATKFVTAVPKLKII